MNKKQLAILELLDEHGEMYALDMVKKSKKLKRYFIYIDLAKLEDADLITYRRETVPPDQPRSPRKCYRINDRGRKAKHDNISQTPLAWRLA